MKAIIFDAGTIINFSMNSLLHLLVDLRKKFNGKFLITKEVESGVVTRPMTIKKYKLEALRVQTMIEHKVFEFPESVGISSQEVSSLSKKYLNESNELFFVGNKSIHLIDSGESSCLALSKLAAENGIKNVIAIDERTTRMLYEKPENLREILESKLHEKIISRAQSKNAKEFEFIRSSEIIYVAFKKGLIKNKSREMLDAMLYGAKFKGCSISTDEIAEIKKIASREV